MSFVSESPEASPYTLFAAPRIAGLADCWKAVLQRGVRGVYRRNSVVRAEGPTRFDLFYVEEGRVQVLFDTMDGRMRSVVSFEPGSMFNLAQAATRTEASGLYQCVTDAVIWRIPGELLHDAAFAAAHPELMLAVVHILGRLVLTHHTFLTDMLMDDFVIRFSRFLMSMSEERGEEFAPGMTQDELAAMCGVHRATLARAIQRLKKDGVISGFTKNRVRILNREALHRLADGKLS